jgi:hypothetical protein
VRLQTDAPPYWWLGDLVITTDRLFFLPDVENPHIAETAFWLDDLTRVAQDDRTRFTVAAGGRHMSFEALTPTGYARLLGAFQGYARHWVDIIARLRPAARPSISFDDERSHRAAG